MRLLGLLGLLLVLCITSLSMVGCRSGGDPDVAIVIESVSPTGIVGTPGDTVQFSADVTGIIGTAVYTWSFGGGGTADNVASPTPNVVLGSVSPYSGTLTVEDGTTNDTLPFSFEVVDVPVVQSVTPTGSAGLPLGVVQFSAEILGSPTSFDWTFSGGVLPTTSSDEEPVVTLQNPGSYSGVLIATNGSGDSEAFPFDFTVDAPVAPSWTIVKVGAETASGQDGLSAKVVEGRLILSYNMMQNVEGVLKNTIRFTQATTEIPTLAVDFVSHTVDSEIGELVPKLSGTQSLGVSEAGIPYLIYGTRNSSPGQITKLARGLTSLPTEAADWAITTASPSRGTNFAGTAILPLADHLCVLLPDAGDVFALVADSLTPAGAGDWTLHLAGRASDLPFFFPSATMIGDKLQFSSGRSNVTALGSVSFSRALVEEPEAESDWQHFAVDLRDVSYKQRVYLADWDEKPLIYAHGSPGTLNACYLYFGDVEQPENQSDFERVKISAGGVRAWAFGLTTASGRLAACYGDLDSNALGVLRQVKTDPSAADAWETTEVGPIGQDLGRPAAITVLEDRIVIVFVDPRDDLLTLAIADSSY